MVSRSESSMSLAEVREVLATERKENKEKLKGTYLRLRTYIGALTILLPVIVWLFDLILRQGGLQPSISAYYHTEMRNWFVGTMFAIGVFLLTYNPGLVNDAYKKDPDQKFSFLAGILAIIVAITPTGRVGWNAYPALDPPLPPVIYNEEVLNNIHFSAVALLFVLLAYFSLVLFRKSDPSQQISQKKKRRNRIYLWCGRIMAVCVLLIFIHVILPYVLPDTAEAIRGYNLLFCFEFAAIWAFGISWFVKGEALKVLND